MRWIVYSLILINLAIPVYFLVISPEESSAVASETPVRPDSGVRMLGQDVAESYQGKKLCYALGPYKASVDVRLAQARAVELGLTALINEIDSEQSTGEKYRVIVPPLPDREQALRILRELQDRSIDSYMINSGDQTNGISLGLFSNQSSAITLQKKMKSLGFNAVIIEQRKPVLEYWIEVREVSRMDDRVQSLVRGRDKAVSWQLVSCDRQGGSAR
ncbi:MAG TPA: hypothetical protein DEA26_03000 [Oceanospirillales bacterium]|nr:hypothetical protein [Oceanospirillaceae bacterium]HBS41623.1 hypothetical protein [Oceanospirillales bacterium]|tara:strand:+ start:27475 stop:28125 length:651 start_codon:yes stop_codon:yes gene_type:complete